VGWGDEQKKERERRIRKKRKKKAMPTLLGKKRSVAARGFAWGNGKELERLRAE